MDKKSFKVKNTAKKKDLHQEKLDMLEEKYQKIKEILKQVLKDLQNEKEKNEILQKEYTKLEDELKEKDDLLEKMQSVSEAVVDEFSTLKAKCEMEAEAANKAIKRATRYFQENLKLKENQSKEQPDLTDLSVGEDSIVFREDSLYSDVSELEILNKSNSDLRAEIASLKIQLEKEVENQILLKEDFEAAKLLYEQEVKEHKSILEKFRSLEMLHGSIIQSGERRSLQNGIADKNNINQEDRIKTIKILESENNNSKLEYREENLIATITVIEQQKESLPNKIKDLEKQILHLKSSESHNESLCIPPPPPPPPPPSFNPIKSLFTFIYTGRKAAKKPIALSQENNENVHQAAMSEMINAIKKGSIQLKPVPKVVIEKEENITEPIALVEMRNILKSLKKRECFANGKAKETKNEDLSNNTFDVSKNVNMKGNFKEEVTSEPNSCPVENHTPFVSKKESLSNNTFDVSKNVNMKGNFNDEVTSEPNSCPVETHTLFVSQSGNNKFPHQEVTSNQQACLGVEVANPSVPLPIENHSKSSFVNENNMLLDQNLKNHRDNDFPPVDNSSNCSSGSLNGIEFPSYSSSILEDSREDFVVTI